MLTRTDPSIKIDIYSEENQHTAVKCQMFSQTIETALTE